MFHHFLQSGDKKQNRFEGFENKEVGIVMITVLKELAIKESQEMDHN